MNLAPAASIPQVQAGDAVSILVLRKVLDMQQSNAAQLIASLPVAPQPPEQDATLGLSVDAYA